MQWDWTIFLAIIHQMPTLIRVSDKDWRLWSKMQTTCLLKGSQIYIFSCNTGLPWWEIVKSSWPFWFATQLLLSLIMMDNDLWILCPFRTHQISPSFGCTPSSWVRLPLFFVIECPAHNATMETILKLQLFQQSICELLSCFLAWCRNSSMPWLLRANEWKFEGSIVWIPFCRNFPWSDSALLYRWACLNHKML